MGVLSHHALGIEGQPHLHLLPTHCHTSALPPAVPSKVKQRGLQGSWQRKQICTSSPRLVIPTLPVGWPVALALVTSHHRNPLPHSRRPRGCARERLCTVGRKDIPTGKLPQRGGRARELLPPPGHTQALSWTDALVIKIGCSGLWQPVSGTSCCVLKCVSSPGRG